MIQIAWEHLDQLMEMVKQGNEVHIRCTPEDTEIEVMPWKPFEYICPYRKEERGETWKGLDWNIEPPSL